MTRTEELQQIRRDYQRETGKTCITPQEMAEWAIDRSRYKWIPSRSDTISKCVAELSHAMNQETFVDEQGRTVRLMRAVSEKRGQKTMAFWESMLTAPREHIALSFQQRRIGIVADCRKLKVDVDSYNQNRNNGQPIQMVFDFTDDLAEMECMMELPKSA